MNNRLAVIDLGTNNIQILIAEYGENTRIIYKNSFVTELGKNFKNNLIDEKRLIVAKNILKDAIELSKNYTEHIIVIGTSLSREAKNIYLLKDFITSFGVKFKIISGDEEAYLNGIANINDFSGDFVLFDIGGGSTEFTFIKNKKIIKTVSINLGIRRLDEKYCNLMQKTTETKALLKKLILPDGNFNLVGIGGTVTSLLFLIKNMEKYVFENVHKQVITKNQITKIFDDFVTIHTEKYKNSQVFEMFSLELLATGIMIVLEIMEIFNKDKLFVSDKNLMFGVLYAKNEYGF